MPPSPKRARAPAAVATAPAAAQPASPVCLLAFAASGQLLALELAHVVEVLRMVAPTPVSGAAADLLGVIDCRGTVVPLLDLAARLGLPLHAPGLDSRIVVVATRAGPLGLVVDRVDGLVWPGPGGFSPRQSLPFPGSTQASSLVAGALRSGDRLVPVLEPDRLWRDAEPRPKPRRPKRSRPRRSAPQEPA